MRDAERLSGVDPKQLFIRGDWRQLALEDRTTAGLIGDVGVSLESDEPTAELGFTIARAHWGHRSGSEALAAVASYLFRTEDVARVLAFTHAENTAAQHALGRAGLHFIAADGEELLYVRGADESPGGGADR